MFKLTATDVVVSKGFDNAPALKFSEKGDSVRFRFGKKVYDTRAENNTRWVNMTAKAFGPVAERIKKMQIKEGSYVHLSGRLDEESWTDESTQEKRSMMLVILDEIEYAAGGGDKSSKDKQEQPKAGGKEPEAGKKDPAPEDSDNFSGYEPFGGGSFFDET